MINQFRELRLITLYQCAHDALWARSGQAHGPLKVQYIRPQKDAVMGWVNNLFSIHPVIIFTDTVSLREPKHDRLHSHLSYLLRSPLMFLRMLWSGLRMLLLDG